ncbi:hypothetical protein RRG08_042351 [Elysia crispata]|uniref:Methyltransferase type 11 domain-containing protein n=1 Tax=Elysia crispata TaxID=231223 RepID=A0AAE0ZCC4_9GAST|nr:hypothetical protein RRG08_042351 [Elysia crispata]
MPEVYEVIDVMTHITQTLTKLLRDQCNKCPSDCHWHAWSSWHDCPVPPRRQGQGRVYTSRARTAHKEQYGGRPCVEAAIEPRACPVLPLGEVLAGQRWYGMVRSEVEWQGQGKVLARQRWNGKVKVKYWHVKIGMASCRCWCGPGMSTIGFAQYFKKVIGIDISETQIACAPTDIPNCEFKVGYSGKLPFIEAGTVDLFCCGSSFHWLPQKETLAEADRVLKPGGTIAIFGYDLPRCDIPEVEACLQSPPRNDEMKNQLNYMEAHPTQDFLGDVAEELRQALHTSGTDDINNVTFNLYLFMIHKPMN